MRELRSLIRHGEMFGGSAWAILARPAFEIARELSRIDVSGAHEGGDAFVSIAVTENEVRREITTTTDFYQDWLATLDPPKQVGPTPKSDQTRRFATAVREEVSYRRAQSAFRFARFYSLRNEIVHEAFLYRPDLAILADSLCATARSVLTKVIDVRVHENALTIPDIIDYLNRPWM